MSASCWVSRHEAMGYESVGDAIIALGEDGLSELWTLSGRIAGEWVTDDDPWALADPLYDICFEPSGHQTPHDFTPTDEISVEFSR